MIVTRSADGSSLSGVSVRYGGYAAEPGVRINGEESASASGDAIRIIANLAQAATPPVRKLTGPDGFVAGIDPVTGAATSGGMLVTTFGEQTYRAPPR